MWVFLRIIRPRKPFFSLPFGTYCCWKCSSQWRHVLLFVYLLCILRFADCEDAFYLASSWQTVFISTGSWKFSSSTAIQQTSGWPLRSTWLVNFGSTTTTMETRLLPSACWKRWCWPSLTGPMSTPVGSSLFWICKVTASIGLLFETRGKAIISKENLVLRNGPNSHLYEKIQSSRNLWISVVWCQ